LQLKFYQLAVAAAVVAVMQRIMVLVVALAQLLQAVLI
jgi:hypothetical protein